MIGIKYDIVTYDIVTKEERIFRNASFKLESYTYTSSLDEPFVTTIPTTRNLICVFYTDSNQIEATVEFNSNGDTIIAKELILKEIIDENGNEFIIRAPKPNEPVSSIFVIEEINICDYEYDPLWDKLLQGEQDG